MGAQLLNIIVVWTAYHAIQLRGVEITKLRAPSGPENVVICCITIDHEVRASVHDVIKKVWSDADGRRSMYRDWNVFSHRVGALGPLSARKRVDMVVGRQLGLDVGKDSRLNSDGGGVSSIFQYNLQERPRHVGAEPKVTTLNGSRFSGAQPRTVDRGFYGAHVSPIPKFNAGPA